MRTSLSGIFPKASLIILLVLILAGQIGEAQAELARPCEKGLAVCLVSSVLEAAIPALWASYSTWCFAGYSWCIAYADRYF
ncbi:MAG TPA: hypothetical protein PL181_16275 [bacterium]|nr:hypothetical protein [bacterium]